MSENWKLYLFLIEKCIHFTNKLLIFIRLIFTILHNFLSFHLNSSSFHTLIIPAYFFSDLSFIRQPLKDPHYKFTLSLLLFIIFISREFNLMELCS
jgi:hypothetical protein